MTRIVEIWPVREWAVLETHAARLALCDESITSVKKPSDFVVLTEAEFILETDGIIFSFLEELRRTVAKASCSLAVQKLFTKVFIKPLRNGFRDLNFPRGVVEEWDELDSTMNPQTVSALHQMSLELDLEELRMFYDEARDEAVTKDEAFDYFLETARSWQHLLQESAAKELGLLVASW